MGIFSVEGKALTILLYAMFHFYLYFWFLVIISVARKSDWYWNQSNPWDAQEALQRWPHIYSYCKWNWTVQCRGMRFSRLIKQNASIFRRHPITSRAIKIVSLIHISLLPAKSQGGHGPNKFIVKTSPLIKVSFPHLGN